MTDELVVRAYNVGFGDAVLVSIPEDDGHGEAVVRHLLIDVGNLLAGKGNENTVFDTVVADITKITGGVVDLYVMTHEHLDHVQGLLSAHQSGHPLTAKHAWLTGSAAPGYYDAPGHEDARLKKLDHTIAYLDVVAQLDAGDDPWLSMMIANNGMLAPDGVLGLKTADYVDHVRSLTPAGNTHYVDRTTELAGTHPFTEVELRILAPEENTATYYGRRKSAPALTATGVDAAPGIETDSSRPIVPPVGVDAGAFFDLVSSRKHHSRTAILEIDKANNNTSIVLELTWRGWRLLFPGDAEERSWLTMHDNGDLRPVHLVKVSHHGSINGTEPTVFDVVLPLESHDGRPRSAIVSTHEKDWKSVPHEPTLDLYRARCRLVDTRHVDRGTPVTISFPG